MFINYYKKMPVFKVEKITMIQGIAKKYITKLAEIIQDWHNNDSSLLTTKHYKQPLFQLDSLISPWLTKQHQEWQNWLSIFRSEMAVISAGGSEIGEVNRQEKSRHSRSLANCQLYSTACTPSYQKPLPFLNRGNKATLFYTNHLVSKIEGVLHWVATPLTVQRHSVIIFPKEKLIHRYTILGSLSALWQFVRLQRQRWAGFNARRGGLIAKRGFDILISGTVLALLTPLFLLVALLIRLDSHGQIFFSQIRVGKQGQPFIMWKFRSMYTNAEERKAALAKYNEVDGGVLFKIKQDPRITPVGKFLRKFSIDELPQFYNVLVGDMSLVGPRPPLPNEVAKYTLQQRQRLAVIPGITCIWQVSGRSEIPFPQQVEMDLKYIATQSFFGDLWLLLKTVPAVIKGRGAY